MTRAAAVVLVASGALLAAGPATADWLVTRDGTRIETAGRWQVKGSQVVFTLPGGRLSALRLADVDLEASDAATSAAATGEEKAAEDPPPPAAAPRRPVLVLTNETLATASGAEEEGAGEELDEAELGLEADADETEEGDADEGETESDPVERDPVVRDPVEVASWSSRESGDGAGVEIVGTLRNRGAALVAGVSLTVTVADEEGASVSARAFLDASALPPGGSTHFRAPLSGVYFLAGEPAFEVRSEGFSVLGPPGSESGDDDAGEAGDEGDAAREPQG